MTVRSLSSCALLALALVSVGCTSKPHAIVKQSTYRVTGQVKYQNKPVPNASVIFMAIDGKVSASGNTDGAGLFTLTTYVKDDGAPAGRYKVLVAAATAKEIEPGVLAPEPEGGFKSPVPVKYSNPNTTDIVQTVSETNKNDFTIELK